MRVAGPSDSAETLTKVGDEPSPDVGSGTPRRALTASLTWPIAAGWALLGLPFLFEAIGIVRANTAWLVHRLPDDAFYYLEVARRMSRGEGSTFDGIHATNGYHPLWQWTLVPLSWLFPGQSTFTKATLVLALLLTFVALLLVVRVVWRLAGPGPALVGGILAIHGRDGLQGLAISVNGMEAAAVVTALAALLTALVWWADQPGSRRAVVVGFCCAVAVLARLDLVAVLWLVPVSMAFRLRSWRPAANVMIGAVAIGGPFAVWFLTRYHHVLTTSATIKQHQMAVSFDERFGGRLTPGSVRYLLSVARDYLRVLLDPTRENLADAGSPLAAIIGAAATALALAGMVIGCLQRFRSPQGLAARRSRTLSAEGFGLSVTAAVVVAKAVFDVVNAPLWAKVWYSAPQHFALPFALGAFGWITVMWLWARRRLFGALAAAALIAVCLPVNAGLVSGTHHSPRLAGGWQDEILLASRWILRDGPEGRYGAGDAGLLAYQLDRSRDVVNLDGLVNNYEFAELMSTGATMLELARADGVRYFVSRLTDDTISGEFACAKVLWTSPDAITYGDSLSGTSTAHLYVLDLSTCG
jgi:hypothetical protein